MTKSLGQLDATKAVLLVVDLQTAFAPAISDFEKIVARAAMMVQACMLLGVPIIATEQVPAKLGATAEPLRTALAETKPLEKSVFSACRAKGFAEQLGKRSQILLCGIETHICVNQTAHDLLEMGMQAHLLMDAVGSRHAIDREAGLKKMFGAGVIASSVEMALFEMMGDATHPQFRAIQKLVK